MHTNFDDKTIQWAWDSISGMAVQTPFRVVNQSPTGQSLVARSVVLVDENAQARTTLTSTLKEHDLVVQGLHPLECTSILAQTVPPPALVLLRTDADSELLLTTVRQIQAACTDTPVLLLVPASSLSTALEALDCGAYDYLLEPFTPEQLVAAIRRAIQYRQLFLQNNLYKVNLEQLIAARTETLQRAMQQIERSYDVTLEALGDALDLKDAETEGHSKRVTAYTLALGRAMGLSGHELRVVGRGAFLHDIGKMAIPDSILRKPGKLTPAEQTIMRTHSERGYQMVRKIPFLHDAAEIVYAHQECYDGSGYPRRLRGEQIPMGARIFALADTLDAMTSNRPYRQATTITAARKEMLRCAGTQFDPSIVDVFLATPDSLWQNLREGIMRDGPEFSPFGFTFGDATA